MRKKTTDAIQLDTKQNNEETDIGEEIDIYTYIYMR